MTSAAPLLIRMLFLPSQHLLKTSFDVVKRWVNEAQEAASSDNIMVQVRTLRPRGAIGVYLGVGAGGHGFSVVFLD